MTAASWPSRSGHYASTTGGGGGGGGALGVLMQGVRTAVHVLSVPLHLGFNGTCEHGPPARPPARMRFLWGLPWRDRRLCEGRLFLSGKVSASG